MLIRYYLTQNKKQSLCFLSEESQNPVANPKKIFELKAEIAGFKDEDIKEMLDTQVWKRITYGRMC